MFNIPKIAHFIWYGSKIGRLQKDNLIKCAQLNPDYQVILWIDAHSMYAGEQAKFPSINKIGEKLDRSIVESGTVDPEKFKKKHDKFLEARGVPLLIGPIAELSQICSSNNIKLEFADLIYGTASCANIIHFEKVVRGGNFGAASDILRVEVLLRFGGIYFDHDTKFKSPLGQIQAKHGLLFGVTGSGVRDAVISNAVLAAIPDQAELKLYRARIFKAYQELFSAPEKMLAFFKEKKATPEQLESIQSEYELGTLNRTGPSALRSAHMAYKEENKMENTPSREFWFPRNLVTIESAKAWL